MRYNYLIVDSRGEPVAHGESDDGPERALWEIHVDSGTSSGFSPMSTSAW